jgi:hypothetical protein
MSLACRAAASRCRAGAAGARQCVAQHTSAQNVVLGLTEASDAPLRTLRAALHRRWLAANLYKGFAFHANKAPPPAAADKASS